MTETTFSTEDYKRKIAGLFAKAEATDNEAEQQAFSEAAERLMIKMGIARADLESQGKAKAEDIIREDRVWRTIYAPTMGLFAYRVGLAFGNLSFLQRRDSKDTVITYTIGHKSDVEQYLTLLDSLNLQVWTALRAFRKANRDTRRYHTIHENFVTDRSFIEGYASTVAFQLQMMRTEEESTVSAGTALVLASKQDRVDDWVAEQFPRARPGRSSSRQSSRQGHTAGAAAGAMANLGGKAVGGRRTIG